MNIFFITIELFRQRVTCRIDRTIHEVYISFQISRKVFLGLSVSTIHAQKNVFSFQLFNDTLIVFPVQKSSPCMAGSSLRRMQKILCGIYRDAMERKSVLKIFFIEKYLKLSN